MEIAAINNVTDIIKRPKLDIVPGDIAPTSKQQVQQQSQGLPENKEKAPIGEEQIKNALEQAIEKANKSLASCSTKLEFSIHDQTKEIMVKVLNADTGEVIKEIPSEKSLDRFAAILEEIGWLVDKKA